MPSVGGSLQQLPAHAPSLDISVVIICFNNGPAFLGSLASVVGAIQALGSTLTSEIIVVDDASDDPATQAMLAGICPPTTQFRMVRRQRNGGASAARNEGIRAARGRWVLFLDGDDQWTPQRLTLHHALIGADPEARWTACDYVRADVGASTPDAQASRHGALSAAAEAAARLEADLPPKFALDGATDAALRGCLFHVNTVAVNRQLLLSIGGFDERYRTAEDHDLWIRLSRHATPHYVAAVGAIYTRNPQGITRRLKTPHPDLWKVYLGCLEQPWVRPYRGLVVERLARVVLDNVSYLRTAGRFGDARRLLFALLRHAPGHMGGWRQLMAVLLRRS